MALKNKLIKNNLINLNKNNLTNIEFYKLDTTTALEKLKSNIKGLSSTEAEQRLKKFGPNKIQITKKTPTLLIFLRQFKSLLIAILIFAAIASIFLGSFLDACLIGAIIIANAILGFVQEYRAGKAIEMLEKLATPYATVLRDGKPIKILSTDIVPGDVLVLNVGDKVAADCRLLEAVNLKIDESLLTGESVPVLKSVAKISSTQPLAERKNCVFANTIVSYGKGLGLVYATGQNTEVGKISTAIAEAGQRETPLQLKLTSIAKTLGLATIIIAFIVFLLGSLRGMPFYDRLLLAIALAVAAVPEGLPAIVTMTLALGVARMAKKKAIIRYLPAAETLGTCTVIATDKTGTLTKNEMTVRKLYINKNSIDVSGFGYEPKGQFLLNGKPIDITKTISGNLLLKTSVLCNDATLVKNKDWQIVGDPTEGALLTLAGKAGFWKENLMRELPQVAELSFDAKRKCMSTIHKFKNSFLVLTKGAPDILLNCCKWQLVEEKILPLDNKTKKELLDKVSEFAKTGLRVLGFAYKPLKELPKKIVPKSIEQDLIWLGLAGLSDPLRPEVAEAVSEAKKAGIKVIMVTGDHIETAKAIARELGLSTENILDGAMLDTLTDKKFEEIVEKVEVYARISPEHKQRIVRALQAKGHIVAMTGDGVNDAPALKAADIGVAMGLKGTDVAKEASALILQDDNFATIVTAVKEGRTIYSNIKKFLRYLLSSNFAEIAVIFGASLLFLPIPLLAIHLLWINLVTDGLPALALGIDPPEPGIMREKPRPKEEKPIDKEMLKTIAFVSTIITLGTLFIFYYTLPKGLFLAQSTAFTTLVLFELFNVYNTRSEYKSAFALKRNVWLNLAVLSSLVLQLTIIYWPKLQPLLHTTSLNLDLLAMAIGLSSTVLILSEIRKLIKARIKND
ncbi:MAG: cation-translocating P-type ATPase [Candidatus Nanoarchaeia archaeon]